MFCNVQTLITNGLLYMVNGEEIVTAVLVYSPPQSTASHVRIHRERKEYVMFREFLRLVPGLEGRLMESPEEQVTHIADLVRLTFTT